MTEKTALRRAIFLDRDGTLNRDTGYVHRKEDWHWLPGVVEALRRFRAAGYLLVVVSNEVGWGLVPPTLLGRRFRDLQGRANQRVGALADHVALVVAGIPLWIKGGPRP